MLTHQGTKQISTDRLLLRKFKIDDADDMFKNWANDSEVTRFLTWEPHQDVEITRNILEEWVNEYKNNDVYHWAIELKEIGQVIGDIVARLDEKNSSCEIGYCISKRYWGQGIMTESLRTVIDYLFSEIGFNRISATHDTDNIGSGKVMIKSGMKYEGTLRQARVRNDGEFFDLALYAILRREWLEGQD